MPRASSLTVNGQTKAILSDVVHINPIIDSDGDVATGRSFHPASLGTRPGWVCTLVLSVCDPEVHVVGLDLDALNGLDCIRDVGVVDKRAVPGGEVVSI